MLSSIFVTGHIILFRSDSPPTLPQIWTTVSLLSISWLFYIWLMLLKSSLIFVYTYLLASHVYCSTVDKIIIILTILNDLKKALKNLGLSAELCWALLQSLTNPGTLSFPGTSVYCNGRQFYYRKRVFILFFFIFIYLFNFQMCNMCGLFRSKIR